MTTRFEIETEDGGSDDDVVVRSLHLKCSAGSGEVSVVDDQEMYIVTFIVDGKLLLHPGITSSGYDLDRQGRIRITKGA